MEHKEAKRKPAILHVEDDPTMPRLVTMAFKKYPFDIDFIWATTLHEAKQVIEASVIDLIICDDILTGDEAGLDLLSFLSQKNLSIPFIYFPDEPRPRISHVTYENFSVIHKSQISSLVTAVKEIILGESPGEI